jgi:hypothetical protein
MLCKKAGNRFSRFVSTVAHLLCPHDMLHCGAQCWLKRPAPYLRLKQCCGRIELRHRVKVFGVEAE